MQLTEGMNNNYDPVWLTNDAIVFKSNRDNGLGNIWKMNALGADLRNLTKEMENSEQWKPEPISSSEIFFTVGTNSQS